MARPQFQQSHVGGFLRPGHRLFVVARIDRQVRLLLQRDHQRHRRPTAPPQRRDERVELLPHFLRAAAEAVNLRQQNPRMQRLRVVLAE
jgi:hypothetical protein